MQSRKNVSYGELSDGSAGEEKDEDDVFRPVSGNTTNRRSAKRRKVSLEESDDEFDLDGSFAGSFNEDGRSELYV
jgi:DNA mismatch repair protein MSH6